MDRTTRATHSCCGAQGRWNPLREQLVQLGSAFVQAVFGALVQDQLFRLLHPVANLHLARVGEPSFGFAVHHQQRTRGQLSCKGAP